MRSANMGGQLIEDVADFGDSENTKGMQRRKKATCITVGLNNNCPLEQGSKHFGEGVTCSANWVNMERVVTQTVVDFDESSRDHYHLAKLTTCLVEKIVQSGDLVDIPIIHSLAKDKGTLNLSKGKKRTIRRNISRSKGKQAQIYTRKRRFPDHDRDIAAKKIKDIIDVDNTDNITEFAKVGQAQPRQSL